MKKGDRVFHDYLGHGTYEGGWTGVSGYCFIAYDLAPPMEYNCGQRNTIERKVLLVPSDESNKDRKGTAHE